MIVSSLLENTCLFTEVYNLDLSILSMVTSSISAIVHAARMVRVTARCIIFFDDIQPRYQQIAAGRVCLPHEWLALPDALQPVVAFNPNCINDNTTLYHVLQNL